MYEQNQLQGDLRKIKPPNFDGKTRWERMSKLGFLQYRKYFKLDNYSSNLEAKVLYTSYKKDSIWWDQLKKFKHIDKGGILRTSSRSISSNNIFLRTTMTRIYRSSLKSSWEI
jgi:hypothetical protein